MCTQERQINIAKPAQPSQELVMKLSQIASWSKRTLQKKSVRLAAFSLGAILLLTGLLLSFRDLRSNDLTFDTQYFVVAFLFMVAFLCLQILRFQQLCASVDHRCSFLTASKIVIYGAIANILPFPGSLAMRFTYLSDKVGPKKTSAAIVTDIVIWLAMTFAAVSVAWLAQKNTDQTGIFAIAFSSAVVLTSISITLAKRLNLKTLNYLLIHVVQAVISVVLIIKLQLVAKTISAEISSLLASLMTLAATLTTTIGVVPGGLGISEVISSSATTALGEASFSLGFTIASLDRFLAWLALFFSVSILALVKKLRNRNHAR